MNKKIKSISIDGVVYPFNDDHLTFSFESLWPTLSRKENETKSEWLERLERDYGLVEKKR